MPSAYPRAPMRRTASPPVTNARATAFRAAVDAYRFDGVVLPAAVAADVRAGLDESGVVVVGEPHGVHETPAVVLAVAEAADADGIALEWSHEEMGGLLHRAVTDGTLELDGLWSLPPTAEAFCGDGRITAGHFAMLQRLRELGRLRQAIAFDQLDPESERASPLDRDRELADRLLAEWDGTTRLLVVTGAAHARLDAGAGETMATIIRRTLPRLRTAMIAYAAGTGWFRGSYDLPRPMPDAPIRIDVPAGSPAVVPRSR